MNDLIKGQLIVDKQIKNEFYLYAFRNKISGSLYFGLLQISGLKKAALKRFGYLFNMQANKLAEVNERCRLEALEREVTANRDFFADIRNYCLRIIRKDRWPTGAKITPIVKRHHRLLVKKINDFVKNPTVLKADDILNSLNRSYNIDKLRLDEIVKHVKSLEIPSRYAPVEEMLEWDENTPLVRVRFKEQIISLMEQKYPDDNYVQMIVKFFKELCAKDKGLDFDEYIDSWVKRLMKEVVK